MTTKVTVDAHAGWPVKVTITDKYADRDETVTTETVEPLAVRDYYLTNTRSISFEELPHEPKAA